MASSNVQFYENQKKLQDTITKCEQQRANLDQQLKNVFQKDQTSIKLKAARLHTYWKKICEDERKAKQRNELILREFERIDSHMSELKARSKKLALIKKEYEDSIARKYPDWIHLMNGLQNPQESKLNEVEALVTPVPKQQFLSSEQQSKETLQNTYHHVSVVNKSHMTGDVTVSRSQAPENRKVINHENQSTGSLLETKDFSKPAAVQPQNQQQENLAPANHEKMSVNENMNKKKETQSSNYVNVPDTFSEVINEKRKQDDTQSEVSSIKDLSVKLSHRVTEEDEDSGSMMEFMSGSDLPMALSLGNTQIETQVKPSASSSKPDMNCVKPELSVQGLIFLLKFIESDVSEAVSYQGYYRSSWPDPAHKNAIIRKGNAHDDLSRIDADQVSMVVMEQVTLVVRNMKEKCLLPLSLFQGDTTKITSQAVRQQLSSEALVIWDALFAHFTHLVKADALEPNELSAIFTPCLVPDGNLQEKAHQFMCHLLSEVKMNHSTNPASQQLTIPLTTLESSGNLEGEIKVPPLKFGSLLEKPFSDDESSYLNSSLPQDSIPLNQTDAYRSMISSSSILQTRQQSLTQEETTDDDVEKQIASAIKQPITKNPQQPKLSEKEDLSEMSSQTMQTTSNIYSPRAFTPRQSGKPLYGSQQLKLGVKISSDLDTDTEMDAGIFGSSKKVEDDFDFYD